MENQKPQEQKEPLFNDKEFFSHYRDKPTGSSQVKMNELRFGNVVQSKSIMGIQRSRMNGFR